MTSATPGTDPGGPGQFLRCQPGGEPHALEQLRKPRPGSIGHSVFLAVCREDDKYGEGTTLAGLAGAYQDMRRTGDALGYYQQALAVFERANAADDANQIRARITELINTSPT